MSTNTESSEAKVTAHREDAGVHPHGASPVIDEPVDTQAEVERASVANAESGNAESGNAEMDAAGEVSPWQVEIDRLTASNRALKDDALRAQADAQNARRRAEKEIENARKYALEGFAKELVPMFDSLESGLEKIPEDDPAQAAAREGLSLTLKQGLEALRKYHVEQLYPLGQPFDPALHQAMAMQESPDCEPNTVLHVLQKGYTLSGRLVRPAMVIVSKAAATQQIDESV